MALSVSDGVPAVVPGCVQEYSPAVALPGPGANFLIAVLKNRNEAVFILERAGNEAEVYTHRKVLPSSMRSFKLSNVLVKIQLFS